MWNCVGTVLNRLLIRYTLYQTSATWTSTPNRTTLFSHPTPTPSDNATPCVGRKLFTCTPNTVVVISFPIKMRRGDIKWQKALNLKAKQK